MDAMTLVEVDKGIEEQAPAPLPIPAPEAEAAPAPAPVPAPAPAATVAEAARPGRMMAVLPIVAVTLAAFASLLAVIGLMVATRTIASASLVVADARERQKQMAEVGDLIERIDALRIREEAALERIDRLRAAGGATRNDVYRAIDDLRQDIVKRNEDGGALGLVRSGQSELAERIGLISMKLERIEAAVKVKPRPADK